MIAWLRQGLIALASVLLYLVAFPILVVLWLGRKAEGDEHPWAH